MNNLKNRHLISCLTLAVFLLGAFWAPAQAAEKNPAAVITATGNSAQEFSPDVACITLAVQTEGATAALAQTQNAQITNRVKDQILFSGVKEKDLKTTSYLVVPIYRDEEPGSRKKPSVIGYKAINSMSVYVPADKAGQMIDLALQSGATQITGVRFTLKDNKKMTQEAVAVAVKDALDKVEAIAKALDKKIVRIQSVNELNTNIRPTQMENRVYAANMNMNESYDSTPISQGTVTVSSSVQVTVEIE